jgi:hypothetical protein
MLSSYEQYVCSKCGGYGDECSCLPQCWHCEGKGCEICGLTGIHDCDCNAHLPLPPFPEGGAAW